MEFTLYEGSIDKNIRNVIENGDIICDTMIIKSTNKQLNNIIIELPLNNDVLSIVFGYVNEEFVINYIISDIYGNVYFEFSASDYNFIICCVEWSFDKGIDSIYTNRKFTDILSLDFCVDIISFFNFYMKDVYGENKYINHEITYLKYEWIRKRLNEYYDKTHNRTIKVLQPDKLTNIIKMHKLIIDMVDNTLKKISFHM